ncbi:magnesium/cobalt transporter CorA [Paenibacillus thalictri]|uniref:Magnesium transport protein CorA n=1 Tax=Paenibacillus thalictri TaxID=2527873 RepID=A0A4V2J4D0_9BACL|nr:magnesium/cobalt transporter CorA [Paenibacillus thalictri]TBL78591.1 magnesium/cobalt transporter CorA [Paenibacillus thalictri]
MIRSIAVTHDSMLLQNEPLERLMKSDISWYWVDLNAPTAEETQLLEHGFHFHPLAIEDCLHLLQRPKLDHYDDVQFLVLHAINPKLLKAEEVNMFIGPNYIVTYHNSVLSEMDSAWSKLVNDKTMAEKNHLFVAYTIIDKLVDEYFPSVFSLEGQVADLEDEDERSKIDDVMNLVFEIRGKLLKLRRTIVPMRDLLYRIQYTEKIAGIQDYAVYFKDIYDHLLKLSEMIETNREITSDIRDGHMSMSSNRMNNIMKTLTVITTIFMPLTFIAGIYGMNFDNMPELSWKYGYFFVLGVMFGIGVGMYVWFRRKGWFS